MVKAPTDSAGIIVGGLMHVVRHAQLSSRQTCTDTHVNTVLVNRASHNEESGVTAVFILAPRVLPIKLAPAPVFCRV